MIMKMSGTVIMIAYSRRKSMISDADDSLVRISPGAEAPAVIDTKFANTVPAIMEGIDLGLNQLFAKIDGEFKIKTPPMAAKADPTRHQVGWPTSIAVLSQTPPITNTLPILHPQSIPHLSRIQLAGTAQIGCKTGNIKHDIETCPRPMCQYWKMLMQEGSSPKQPTNIPLNLQTDIPLLRTFRSVVGIASILLLSCLIFILLQIIINVGKIIHLSFYIKPITTNMDQAPKINASLVEHNQYKSLGKMLAISVNACLSSFFVGYSLTYMGTLPDFSFIIQTYDVHLASDETTESLVQGFVPIGAIFGALLSSQLIGRFSRRNSFLVTNAIAVAALLILYVKSPWTLIIGRLLQGICVGLFSALVPLYLNEILTPDLSNLGTLNQLFIAFSQAFSFFLYFLLYKLDYTIDDIWRWLTQFLLLPIIFQSIVLVFFFPYDTPKYLFQMNYNNKANELLSLLYHQSFADESVKRFLGDQEETLFEKQSQVKKGRYQNLGLAIFFAIHLALLQQMSGVNAIVVYGKQTLQEVVTNPTISDLLPIFITIMPAFAAFLTIYLMKRMGRKPLIQLGTVSCGFCLLIMFLSFLFKEDLDTVATILIAVAMVLFMAAFGLTLGPLVWLYIPQIVQPNIVPFSTMSNLTGATICIMVFPILKKQLPDQNPAFLFLIFFIWCAVSLFINWKYMVETRNRLRSDIFAQYKQKRIC